MWSRVKSLFGKPTPGTDAVNRPLVKPRPKSFADSYHLSIDGGLVDELFEELRLRVYHALDKREPRVRPGVVGWQEPSMTPSVLREFGRLDEDRRYFYLKPMGQYGWLFERNSGGWLISRAEKIEGQETFIRGTTPWDAVTVQAPSQDGYALRVNSSQMQAQLVSLSSYANHLLKELRIII